MVFGILLLVSNVSIIKQNYSANNDEFRESFAATFDATMNINNPYICINHAYYSLTCFKIEQLDWFCAN